MERREILREHAIQSLAEFYCRGLEREKLYNFMVDIMIKTYATISNEKIKREIESLLENTEIVIIESDASKILFGRNK